MAPTALTETKERGHYSVSFSPFGGVYQLNYGSYRPSLSRFEKIHRGRGDGSRRPLPVRTEGPGVPWQKLVKLDDPGKLPLLVPSLGSGQFSTHRSIRSQPAYTHVLTNNTVLREKDAKFQHAEISYPTITIDSPLQSDVKAKVELNAMELRPPLMDLSGKTKHPVLFQVYVFPSRPLDQALPSS